MKTSAIYACNKTMKLPSLLLVFFLPLIPAFPSLAQNINVSNTDINIPAGTYLTAGGSITLQNSGGIVNNGVIQLSGNWNNNGNGLINSGTGTVEFNGTSAQTIGGTSVNTFFGLKINNSSGVTLASNTFFNGNLNLASGIVSAGSYTLSALSGFSVNRTSGYVNGYFSKPFATGSNVFQSFEVGTPSSYTPVSVTMTSVTAAGSLKVKSNPGDHPQISSACLNSSKSVNLYYSFANSGIIFTNASVTLNYTAADLDAGIASFRSKYYDGTSWGAAFSNTGTNSSITLTGVTQLAGDFQVAELNPNPVATPSGPVSICNGGSTAISVVASGGSGSGYTYLWSPSAGLSSTTVSNPTANPSTSTTYSVTVTDANNCISAAGTVAVTVTPNVAASVSIAASPSGSICPGTSVTFTATPVNGGATPAYQWKVNGTNVGTGATFNSSTLANNDVVTCVMTSSVTCVTGSPATSNTVTMTVNPSVPVSVSIAASPSGNICSGTSVTFTATPTNGGTTPVYQWKVNGTNVGSNSATFISSSLVNSDAVTCQMTSNVTCPSVSPAISNTVTMSVTPNAPASVSIAASPSTSICSGTSVTFTATPTNGGSTPAYQWKLNGTNVGTSATFNSSTLANNDVVTCVMTSNASCVTGSPATSNTLTMSVTAAGAASVSIAASPSTTVCSGASVTFTATPTNGGAPTYQWRLNGANVGSNNATFITSSLVNSDAVTCVMTSGLACATGSPATSNTVTMTVNPSVPVSVSIAASPSGSICSGASVTFTASPTNGGTTPVYQWKVNGVNAGANSATFISSTLANADTVICLMTSNVTCPSVSPATSNSVIMNVTPNVAASVSVVASPAGSICSGTSVTFTATPTNGGTPPAYQWKVNGTNVGTGATFNSTTLANNDVVTCVMTSSVTCVTGSPATSNAVTMTVNSNVAAGVSIAANPLGSICPGTSVTFTASPTNGGSSPTYQWKVNGANVGTNSATFISSGLANADAVTCVMTSGVTCVTGSPATSNTVTMIVNPNVAASVSVAASPSSTICSGTNVTFTATATNGGAGPTYQWKLNGSDISGATASTYSSSTLVNGDQITAFIISNAACVSPATAISPAVTMTVNPDPSVTNSPLATTVCSGISWPGLSLTADIAGTNYSWTSSVSGSITGNTSSGTGNIPVQAFTNNSGTAGTVTYSIIPTANGCTGAVSKYIVTVNTGIASTGNITGSASPCNGATGVAYSIPAAAGATGYNWTVPAGASITAGANTTSITVAFGSNSGDITVTPVNTCGSGSTSSLTVTMSGIINSLGAITGPAAVCTAAAGQIYSVSGVAGVTVYNWSVPAGATITSGINSTTITVTFGTVSGLISVAPVNACGSGAASTLDVSVNPVPTVTSAASGTICSGVNQAYTITSASPGTTFNWSRDPLSPTTQTSNPITEALFNPTNSAITVRYVIVPALSGCTGPAFNYDLKVNPSPVVTTTGSTTVCSGSATDINLISNVPGSTFSWATPAITGKITGSAAGNGNMIAQALAADGGGGTVLYQVQATANGCIGASTDIQVSVSPLPAVTANASDTIVCAGTKIILSGSGANNYSWDNGVSDSIPFASTVTKTYTVTGTDFNGCQNTDSITITVYPIPAVVAGSNKTVNEGSSVTLTATGTAASYTWNYGVTDGVSFIASAANSGYYVVTGQLGNCTAKDSLILNVIRPNSPKIVLFYNNNQIINSQQLDIGSQNVTQGPYKYTFTVNNIGSVDLNLSSIFLSASAGDTFSIDQTGTKSVVAPGSLTTFDLIFNPVTIGNKTVKLTIANNDIDVGNFEVNIQAVSNRLKPLITFTLIGDKEYGSDTFDLSATASNGKPITFTSLTPSIVSINGSQVTLLKTGTAIIQASTQQDSIYEAASSQQTFEVTLPAFGILGPDYIVTNVKNTYEIYPVSALFTYYWIYQGNNLNSASDTTVSILADNQTADGMIQCLVYDAFGAFLDTVQKPIVVNHGKSNFLALTKTNCTPAIEDAQSTYIKSFRFENISVTSTYNNSGITDFTQSGFTTELFLGETYSGKLEIGGAKISRAVGVWIDFNNSGEFDSDEFVFDGLTSDSIADITNVRIPNIDGFAGFRRMRVRVRENTAFVSAQSCVENGDKGETEDYIVELKLRNDLQASEGMTPNADGKNDCFVIRGVNPRSVKRSLDVFNISGDLVYTSNFYQNDWCGYEMNSNKLVPRGTYYFVFRTDENTLKSFIEIVY